jgi:gamma-glutamylcyclotransferase (GGCT)/AIG2-like uncharacterized protein YtfP
MKGTFLNDQGVAEELDILEIFEYSDKQYALVQFEEDGEAFIFAIQKDDQDMILEQIGSEQEYQEVRDLILMDMES